MCLTVTNTEQSIAAREAAVGTDGSAKSELPWRSRARLAAVVGNSAMIFYVYLAYLCSIEWQSFGARILSEGQSSSLRDYLLIWDLDPAFDHLRLFTFSEAMLDYLNLYFVVGTPVAVVLLVLERDRIRWLQSLLAEALPSAQASRASVWLEAYLWTLGVMFTFILSIVPFHLERPRAHYICALCAISSGFVSIAIYFMAPIDLEVLAAGSNKEAAAWASQVRRRVHPAHKAVLALHVVVLGSALLKGESLGDDWAALLFGVLETSLVLSYQLFIGVFILDDWMIEQSPAKTQRLKWAAAPMVLKSAAAGGSDESRAASERLLCS